LGALRGSQNPTKDAVNSIGLSTGTGKIRKIAGSPLVGQIDESVRKHFQYPFKAIFFKPLQFLALL